VPVAADHPAEVATSIVWPVVGWCREPSETHQLVVQGEMRPAVPAMLCAADVLPASSCEEPVVTARHQLRPVLQRDPVGGLHRRPMVDDVRRHVAPVRPVANRPVDGVPHPNVGER
jgi:hypothetical protein